MKMPNEVTAPDAAIALRWRSNHQRRGPGDFLRYMAERQ